MKDSYKYYVYKFAIFFNFQPSENYHGGWETQISREFRRQQQKHNFRCCQG